MCVCVPKKKKGGGGDAKKPKPHSLITENLSAVRCSSEKTKNLSVKQRQPNGSKLSVLYFYHTHWASHNIQLTSSIWRLIISKKAIQETREFFSKKTLALNKMYFQAVCENWEKIIQNILE